MIIAKRGSSDICPREIKAIRSGFERKLSTLDSRLVDENLQSNKELYKTAELYRLLKGDIKCHGISRLKDILAVVESRYDALCRDLEWVVLVYTSGYRPTGNHSPLDGEVVFLSEHEALQYIKNIRKPQYGILQQK